MEQLFFSGESTYKLQHATFEFSRRWLLCRALVLIRPSPQKKISLLTFQRKKNIVHILFRLRAFHATDIKVEERQKKRLSFLLEVT